MTEYRRKKLAVDDAEKFYNLEDAVDRGGDSYVQEFRDIQEEMFKVQQEFYNVLKDGNLLGLTKQDLRKLLKRRKFGNKEINLLFRGKFIPFKANEALMQKRLRELKKAYPDRIINKDFFYPRKDFNEVMREYSKKSLKVKPEVKQEVEETETPSVIDRLRNMVNPTNTGQQSQVPPLPNTPTPRVQTASLKSPITGLTRTESALLSPTEQVIARRT